MELRDIGGRIFGGHSRLIVSLVVCGIVVALVLQATSGRTYTASTRLVLDTADTTSRTDSQAVADTAKALATSPTQVREALEHVGADRNAVEVAKTHVAVTTLGTSGVLELSVSDRDRRVATALANALAQRVIAARVAFSNGRLQEVLVDLQKKIDELNVKIAALDVQADSLAVRLAGATSAVQSNDLRAERDQLVQSRDVLVQQRSVAESERVSLLASDATRPNPEIISRATTSQSPRSWLSSGIVGAVLGLILGIGVAAAIETLRPTVAGGKKLADALDTTLIGALPSAYPGEQRGSGADLRSLRRRLQLAADAVGARAIGLAGVDRSVDLADLAAQLRATAPEDGPAGNVLDVHLLSLDALEANGRRGQAVVAVAPDSVSRAELASLDQQLRLASGELIGLITYKEPEMRRSRESSVRDRVAVVDRA